MLTEDKPPDPRTSHLFGTRLLHLRLCSLQALSGEESNLKKNAIKEGGVKKGFYFLFCGGV